MKFAILSYTKSHIVDVYIIYYCLGCDCLRVLVVSDFVSNGVDVDDDGDEKTYYVIDFKIYVFYGEKKFPYDYSYIKCTSN